MELTIRERFKLMAVVPEQGDILTLKAVRELRESLIPTEDEETFYDIQKVEGMVYWNDQKEPLSVDIELSKRATTVVQETLAKCSEDKTLPLDLLELYEQVCEDSGE